MRTTPFWSLNLWSKKQSSGLVWGTEHLIYGAGSRTVRERSIWGTRDEKLANQWENNQHEQEPDKKHIYIREKLGNSETRTQVLHRIRPARLKFIFHKCIFKKCVFKSSKNYSVFLVYQKSSSQILQDLFLRYCISLFSGPNFGLESLSKLDQN